MKIAFPPEHVSEKLLCWYSQYGRELPWRKTRDPYRIWLSEIMLQQTTVTAVIPYYEKFLGIFPDINILANAPLEKVLEQWAGLGYYSRARNLHATAQRVVQELNGRFPDTVEGLMHLPGIGRSTAGAIVSIAYDRPAPILDGNVRRVLVRLMALKEPPRERQSEKKLWLWAEILTSRERPHDYAQAIMDLGATICLPRQPHCVDCPLQALCQAKEEGLENDLPVKNSRVAIPTRRQVVLIIKKEGKILVQRRPPKGLLGGMWEFPCCEYSASDSLDQVAQIMLADFSPGQRLEFVGTIKHIYSHFRLEAEVFLASGESAGKIAERGESFWQDEQKLADKPLHGAHQKVLKLIMKEVTL